MQTQAMQWISPLRETEEAQQRRVYQKELEEWVAIDDLGILDFSQFSEDRLPDVEWMVDKHFMKGTVALVSGDGGIGKSTLMQQLATCATLGLPWLGFNVEKGPALMLACEDDYIQLLHRHKAIVRSLGIGWKDAWNAGLQVWPRVGQDNALVWIGRDSNWKIAPSHWGERIGLRCKRQGVKYLIVDTATQTMDLNQNDERAVVQGITWFRQLALAMEGVVIITKHPSLSGRALGTGESGNTAWSNSVRSRFYLHREKDGRLLWKGMKSNYGPKGEDIELVWQDGIFCKPDKPYQDKWFAR